MSMYDGKLVIATASPGTRDFIYVGYANRMDDRLIIKQASMIVQYKEVGVPGLTSQPEKAVRLRPVTALDGTVDLPMACTLVGLADPDAWAQHLGVSRG